LIERALNLLTTKPVGQGRAWSSMVYWLVPSIGRHVQIYSESGGTAAIKLYCQGLAAAAVVVAVMRMAVREKFRAANQETILVSRTMSDLRRVASRLLTDLAMSYASATARRALSICEGRREYRSAVYGHRDAGRHDSFRSGQCRQGVRIPICVSC